MNRLEFHLDREVFIRAARATVWKYLTDSERFARWWGQGSHIDARVGGQMLIRYPNGDSASGEVLELVEGERIVVSYGYDQPGKAIGPGQTRVSFSLHDRAAGTLLVFRHSFGDAQNRDLHVDGWRYHLAVFAYVVCEEQHAGVAGTFEQWFTAWNSADPAERSAALNACTAEGIHFVDRYGTATSRTELAAHIANARKYLPITVRALGAARQSCGTALLDWEAIGPDGKAMMRGTNVYDLDGDGKIERVVGIGM